MTDPTDPGQDLSFTESTKGTCLQAQVHDVPFACPSAISEVLSPRGDACAAVLTLKELS